MSTRGPVLPKYYGPALAEVRQIVIHSVESGMTPGIGWSLMNSYWQNPAVQSSVHGISDPADSVYSVPETQRAWHCGNGNSTSVGWEHAGRAAFSTAEWIAPAGVQMLNNSARELAKIGQRHGIPLRWLSVAEVAANAKGYCTHNDMRLARGGTTHTDPGPYFPYKLYMQLLQQWTAGAPVNPTPNPNPLPTGPQTGGAQGQDTNDMADITEAQMDRIAGKVVAQLLSGQAVFPVGDQVTTVAGALADLLRSRLAPKDVWTYGIPPGYDAQSLLYTAAGAPKPAEQPGK